MIRERLWRRTPHWKRQGSWCPCHSCINERALDDGERLLRQRATEQGEAREEVEYR